MTHMDAGTKANGKDVEDLGIPKPPLPFGILNARGDAVKPVPTAMARLDAKAGEKVELSRGTLWLLATLLILGGVIFSYGSSIIGWARDDESQRVKMANVERQVEDLNRKFDELNKALIEQRVQDAVKRGYELKAAEGAHK